MAKHVIFTNYYFNNTTFIQFQTYREICKKELPQMNNYHFNTSRTSTNCLLFHLFRHKILLAHRPERNVQQPLLAAVKTSK